jgi:hypothetical protein
MKEVKKTGKSVEPEAALGKPGRYAGNDLKSHENDHADEPKPSGESNHETLRQGKKGKKESVKQAAHDGAHLAKARKFAVRSEHGGAEEMAYPGK